MPHPVIISIFLCFSSVAMASEPQVSVGEDGSVRVFDIVDATPEQVKALLMSGEAAGSLSPSVLSVSGKPSGNCEILDIRTKGLVSALRVRTLRCPTATGWTETLVQSDDFSAYASEWLIDTTQGRTRVSLRTAASPNIYVPTMLVRRSMVEAGITAITNLKNRLLSR